MLNSTFRLPHSAKFLFVIPLLLAAQWVKGAWISGQFRNAAPGDQVEIFVPHRYIDGQDDHFRAVLDAQSRFSLEAKLLEPQLVFLIFNEDRLPVFLAPEDTLVLKADAFQFPLSVSFNAMAGANNRFLQDYLRQTPLDFNEFNNIRFKIGQYWTAVEMPINNQMESLPPIDFKKYLDSLQLGSVAALEQFEKDNQGALSAEFTQWLGAEITYFWAYHLLVYGHVYAGRHGIQADFFDFMYEAPIISESLGSDWYRSFLLAFMARQEHKTGATAEDFWAGQYQLAGKLLSGKSLAFFRSEMISTAFSAEKYRDLLPLYTDFLQTNEYPAYDEKVEGLYQKYARILPGSMAPTFEVLDYEGNKINLSQLRGKVVYLNFWASWCGACLRKMEFMDEFEAELSGKGIEVINISLDEKPEQWRAALAERPFKGRQLLASSSLDRNLAVLFGVEAVPQYFIIDRKGAFADKISATQPADIRARLLQVAAH